MCRSPRLAVAADDAYAGSWLVTLPYVRFADGTGLQPFSLPIPFTMAAAIVPFAGPFLAGFIMAGVTEGRAGIDRWLRKIVLWRVRLRWYLLTIVGIPAIIVLGAIVLPGVLASYQTPALSVVLSYPVSFVVAAIIGGPPAKRSAGAATCSRASSTPGCPSLS